MKTISRDILTHFLLNMQQSSTNLILTGMSRTHPERLSQKYSNVYILHPKDWKMTRNVLQSKVAGLLFQSRRRIYQRSISFETKQVKQSQPGPVRNPFSLRSISGRTRWISRLSKTVVYNTVTIVVCVCDDFTTRAVINNILSSEVNGYHWWN